MSKKDDDNVLLLFPQGQLLIKDEYPALWALIEGPLAALLEDTHHGQNFVLPDFKGTFINGWEVNDHE